MKKVFIVLVPILIVFAFLFTFTATEEKTTPRDPASYPPNYESLSGCQKQNILWENIMSTEYPVLPDFRPFGAYQLMRMRFQEVELKGDRFSDFAPDNWIKYLHARGSTAKVQIIPKSDVYTGLFQGAECGLLRLSLTYKVEGSRPVAPGLALKILRDKTYSANVSALVSLDGQEKEFNFFKHSMSNIVPTGKDFGQKLVHRIFRRASKYPEELLIDDMAKIGSDGLQVSSHKSPRQLFFVPSQDLVFDSKEHDVREDFHRIPEGSVIYHIYAVMDKHRSFDYRNYRPDLVATFIRDSEHIADIVSTSEFVSSAFGDDGIFYRHQLRPK